MPWSRKLPTPIVLKDGRTLATLADARALVLSLPACRQRSEDWFYAMGLIREAAVLGGPAGVTVTQLIRALKADGLI
jgi:hypothetical protein